ncbi:hypothetical protein CVT24_010797 [Panaeolus cyanescens]|uniref:ATPase inhibitor, mitochondrial n=1 Tax=Panaeolus cyanescens TaxID=181874 RepID=A0A409VGV4_9AGAR|nr:hypothetical protein CVT24_010797 [Panaeolus cyanescens]
MLSAVARRVPRTFVAPVRLYTIGRSEGSVAESRGFSKKEKAHEDQYVKQHEREQIEKLRKQIADKQAELAKLENEAEKKQ